MAESERPRTTSEDEAAELEVLALAEQFAAERRAGREPASPPTWSAIRSTPRN
jgi:hypothetical protein